MYLNRIFLDYIHICIYVPFVQLSQAEEVSSLMRTEAQERLQTVKWLTA